MTQTENPPIYSGRFSLSNWKPQSGEAVLAPDHVCIGWGYVDDEFFEIKETPKYDTLQEAVLSKKAELKNKRDMFMLGGVSINGIEFYTDREDQSTYTTLVLGVLLGTAGDTVFKAANGFYTFTPNELTAYLFSIRDFVQTCFNCEKVHSDKIDALKTIDEVIAYNMDGDWPATSYKIEI